MLILLMALLQQTGVCDPRYNDVIEDDVAWCIVAQEPVTVFPLYADYFARPSRTCLATYDVHFDESKLEWCVTYELMPLGSNIPGVGVRVQLGITLDSPGGIGVHIPRRTLF